MLKCDAMWQIFLTKQHCHTECTDAWIAGGPETLR